MQKKRYDLFQGSKYVYGRKVDWDAYASVDFCLKVKKFLEDIDWLNLANLPKMNFSPQLVNEFYYRIVLKKNEFDDIVLFDDEVIYTFFDGKECILTKNDLRELPKCENYNSLNKVPSHYPSNNVWKELSRPGNI